MKLKRNSVKKLHWKVYKSDFNRKIIEEVDVLDYSIIKEEIVKDFKEATTLEEFKEKVRKDLMYHFWSKCEYEIILSHWPSLGDKGKELKIDIYDQIMLNYDVFIKYVWNTLQGE